MGIDQKGDDVDQQCIGESVVYAPVSEPGLVDVEVIAMTVLHHGRRRRRLFNAVTVLRHDIYNSKSVNSVRPHSRSPTVARPRPTGARPKPNFWL